MPSANRGPIILKYTYLMNFSKSKSSSLLLAAAATGAGVAAGSDLDLGQATTPATLPSVSNES